MRHYLSAALLGSAFLLGSGRTLMASTVSEVESASEATNNRIATAQWIGVGSFTTAGSATVHQPAGWAMASVQASAGGNDVDFYAFITAAGSAVFDVDGAAPNFDSLLSLFNSSGTLIAQDDDSPVELGSTNSSDSLLGTVPLSAGTYYVAVSRYGNGPVLHLGTQFSATHYQRPVDGLDGGYAVLGATAGDTFVVSNTSAGTGKAYTLNISLSAVPEPSTLALLAIGGGILAAWFWRRK
jgi:hypothetical protein